MLLVLHHLPRKEQGGTARAAAVGGRNLLRMSLTNRVSTVCPESTHVGLQPASASASAMATNAPSLNELLHQSQQLTTHAGSPEITSIRLTLEQIESQSRRLAEEASTYSERPSGSNDVLSQTNPVSSRYLMPHGTSDATELPEAIQATRIAKAFEPLRPLADTDVAGYLRHEHEQVILSCLEESRCGTQDAFYRTLDYSLDNSWDAQKRHIVEDLGAFTSPTASGPPVSLGTRQGLSGLKNTSTSLQMHSKMLRYVRVVQQLNDARMTGQSFPLAHAYSDAVAALLGNAGGGGNGATLESWKIVQELVGEHDVLEGHFTKGAVIEREYATSYSDPRVYLGSSDGLSLRKKLIHRSIRSLEGPFRNHMDVTIQRNSVKARADTLSSARDRALAYCRVKLTGSENLWSPELDVITTKDGEVPIWAMIFFLLRSGYSDDALQLAIETESVLRRTDHAFVGVFRVWLDTPDRMLPKSLRDRLLTEFTTRFRLNLSDGAMADPYKLTLYKIMGRFEAHRRFPPTLTSNSSNWLWLQLSMVSEPPVAAGPEDDVTPNEDAAVGRNVYTLGDLASTIIAHGASHFDPKGTSPYKYFQLLLLVGQFERAVDFLASRATTQTDAVQFTITLSYYGLLRVPERSKRSQIGYLTIDSSKADLAATGGPDTPDMAYFDFASLIQRYIRTFVETDPQEALQHAFLVGLNADVQHPIGDEQREECLQLVRRVVLESKDYYALLGDTRNDGSTAPGYLAKYSKLLHISNESEFLASIVGAAAAAAVQSGQSKDAVLLYNLAGDYDTVIAVLNKELSYHLMDADNRSFHSSASRPDFNSAFALGTSLQAADDLFTMAHEILASYSRRLHVFGTIDAQRIQTLRLLLDFKTVMELFQTGQLDSALGMIEATDTIPLQADVSTVARRAEEWREKDPALLIHLPELILVTMAILSQMHASLRVSPYSDLGHQRSVLELRNKARTLLSFAGMVRHCFSTDMYSQLLSLAPQ